MGERRSRSPSARERAARTAGAIVTAVNLDRGRHGDPATSPRHAVPPTASAPDRVHVACTCAGIELDTATVDAQPDGVVLVVSSSMPAGSDLTYISHVGPSGGDPLPVGLESWTLKFPPGQVKLACATAPDLAESGTATVSVEDAHGYWRGGSVTDLGCRPSDAQPSWIGGLSAGGDTAQRAVDGVLQNLARESGGRTSCQAQPAAIGYAAARTQTWVAVKDGRPDLTIGVTRTADTFWAGPDSLCGSG